MRTLSVALACALLLCLAAVVLLDRLAAKPKLATRMGPLLGKIRAVFWELFWWSAGLGVTSFALDGLLGGSIGFREYSAAGVTFTRAQDPFGFWIGVAAMFLCGIGILAERIAATVRRARRGRAPHDENPRA